MTEPELQALVDTAIAGGYTIVQQGAVLAPPEHGVSFNDRVDGFQIGLLGNYGPPHWKLSFDNLLLDTDLRWVHLRKDRGA